MNKNNSTDNFHLVDCSPQEDFYFNGPELCDGLHLCGMDSQCHELNCRNFYNYASPVFTGRVDNTSSDLNCVILPPSERTVLGIRYGCIHPQESYNQKWDHDDFKPKPHILHQESFDEVESIAQFGYNVYCVAENERCGRLDRFECYEHIDLQVEEIAQTSWLTCKNNETPYFFYHSSWGVVDDPLDMSCNEVGPTFPIFYEDISSSFNESKALTSIKTKLYHPDPPAQPVKRNLSTGAWAGIVVASSLVAFVLGAVASKRVYKRRTQMIQM